MADEMREIASVKGSVDADDLRAKGWTGQQIDALGELAAARARRLDTRLRDARAA
jgi:hypothetical protein